MIIEKPFAMRKAFSLVQILSFTIIFVSYAHYHHQRT